MCIIKRGVGAAFVFALVIAMSPTQAAVDVNTSNEAALESITGIGAAKARAIVKEREANGPYKDADDLATRISGLGPKSIAHLRENGLTIGEGGAGSGGGARGGTGGSNATSSNATSGGANVPAQASNAKGAARASQSSRK